MARNEISYSKKLNSWSISGNILEPESGCRLHLWNEDDDCNVTDSVFIHLTPKSIEGMLNVLSRFYILKGENT